MEAPGAQAHYAERLALLPGIGTCFIGRPGPRPRLHRPARQEPDTVHFLFVQSADKIRRPLHDDLLARIALV